MDVHDGFIDCIYSYCDRWCERCALTSWCRLFADGAEIDAERDPSLKAVVTAPPLPQDVPPDPPQWFVEMITEAESEAKSAPEPTPTRPALEGRDHPLRRRSHDYCIKVHAWLVARAGRSSDRGPNDPLTVISWYSSLIPAKIGRALSGLAWTEPGDPDDPHDYDGSVKVALIGIERSHAALLEIGDFGSDVVSLIGDLVWMTDALDRLFPDARRFIRPAFDEPEAVARLLDRYGGL